MTHPKKWLTIKPEGLYCLPGQFFIDPVLPVDTAIITHGHADHARPNHHTVWATPETIAIMQARYGEESARQFKPLSYKQQTTINGVEFYLLPAGHILGSAQVVLAYQGKKVIVSGDYKRRFDPTCPPFSVENCDLFITEATFGLPVFKHPPIKSELNKLLNSLKMFPERCHLVGAYALGKCQRLIMTLRDMGYLETIYLHGAMSKLCSLYQAHGCNLGDIAPATDLTQQTAAGKIVICPPSALHDRWSRRFGSLVVAHASGWMQIRARAKQKGVDLPLIISDHADWPELIQTLEEIKPQEVWVTHGREDALVYYANQLGFKAQALYLLGYEEDED